jgi:acyl-CoA reductase-like NAD-dependent aldehyde dehydrogenase
MTPEVRVLRLLAAARRASAAAESRGLVSAIAESTGLSPAGVRFGFRVLETDPPASDLAALHAAAHSAESVHVILSANVFVAPLRAIAWALALSPRVTVRPSRRDPHLALALHAEAPELFTLTPERAPSEVESGEVHAYGHADSLARIRAALRPGVRMWAHGPGMGVGVVGSDADLALAAAALAEDVVLFDQRGCLSPRVVLALGTARRAEAFAFELASALDALDACVPRGALSDDEREEAARWTDALTYGGDLITGRACRIGVSRTLLVPPTGRHVLVVPCTREEAPHLTASLAPATTVLGATSDELFVLAPPHARRARFGRMQRPPLDGPVDLRARDELS